MISGNIILAIVCFALGCAVAKAVGDWYHRIEKLRLEIRNKKKQQRLPKLYVMSHLVYDRTDDE